MVLCASTISPAANKFTPPRARTDKKTGTDNAGAGFGVKGLFKLEKMPMGRMRIDKWIDKGPLDVKGLPGGNTHTHTHREGERTME